MVDLFVLAAVVACIARTVTQEELVREFQEWCRLQSRTCPRLVLRKLCYIFTCDYCFSHWVAAGVLVTTGYRLSPWGFLVTLFTLVWTANLYLRLFQWVTLLVILTRHLGKWGQPPVFKSPPAQTVMPGVPGQRIVYWPSGGPEVVRGDHHE